MAKVRFTGVAEAPATYAGKYEVTTGSVLDVSEDEANLLLQTGAFEVLNDDSTPARDTKQRSDDTDKTDSNKDDNSTKK